MNLNFNKRKKSAKNNGFYAAIIMCCAAVCLVAWSTAIGNNKTEPFTNEQILPQTQTGSFLTDEEAALDADITTASRFTTTTQPPQTTTTTSPPATTTTAPSEVPASASPGVITMPVAGGKVIKPFSGDELVYSKTMGDWRVHQGVDISAKLGSEVKSATDGTVTDIANDMLYGITVIVKYTDEITVYYSGLSSVTLVSKGNTIKSGDVIGTVEYAPCESADEAHLHLSLVKNGEFVDPVKALGLK